MQKGRHWVLVVRPIPRVFGAVIMHNIFSKVLLLGNVVSMCILDARNQNL